MAGPFGLLTSALGQQNPEDALADWADQQKKQNLAALQGGQPAGPGSDGTNAQTAAAANASGQMQQQEPNATKTPPSLGHMLMDLQQYNERSQGFNQALGLGVAAFAQPRDREMVSRMFNTDRPDPNKIGEMLINAGSNEQGQARNNALLAMANTPEGRATLAKQLNTTPEAIQALALSGKLADAVNTQVTPTPQMANLAQIERYVGDLQAKGTSPNVLSMIRSSMIAGMAGPDAEKAVGDAVAYKTRTGKDAPWVSQNGSVDQQVYKQYVADKADLSNAQSEAAKAQPAVAVLQEMQNKVRDIGRSPALTSLMSKPISVRKAAEHYLEDPSDAKSQALAAAASLANTPLSADELDLISNIRQLQGQQYGAALKQVGLTRPAASEIENINKGLSQSGILSLSGGAYKDQALEPLDDYLSEIIGNSYGASNNLKNMPKKYRPFVNKQFIAGGTRASEDSGSEDWAKDLDKPIPPEEIAKAKASVDKDPRLAAGWRRHWKREGYDVSQSPF